MTKAMLKETVHGRSGSRGLNFSDYHDGSMGQQAGRHDSIAVAEKKEKREARGTDIVITGNGMGFRNLKTTPSIHLFQPKHKGGGNVDAPIF